VLDFQYLDGVGPLPPGSDLFTLTPGVVYTATVSTSVIGGEYEGNPAEPGELEGAVTITSVPEPATLGLLVGGAGLLLRCRR
jgi:hypothetical protein